MAATSIPLGELADIVRSKNAGPFRITLDILFADPAGYRAVRDSGAITKESVAAVYGIGTDDISSLFAVDMASAIKVTLKRKRPQAALGDSDMYGCQQHVPLMSLPVALERE